MSDAGHAHPHTRKYPCGEIFTSTKVTLPPRTPPWRVEVAEEIDKEWNYHEHMNLKESQ